MSLYYSKFDLNTYKSTPYFQAQIPADYLLNRVLQKCRAFRRLPPNLQELANHAERWAWVNWPIVAREMEHWYDVDGYELNPDTRHRLSDAEVDAEWPPPDDELSAFSPDDVPKPPGGFPDPDTWEPPPEEIPDLVDRSSVTKDGLLTDIAYRGRETVAKTYGVPTSWLTLGTDDDDLARMILGMNGKPRPSEASGVPTANKFDQFLLWTERVLNSNPDGCNQHTGPDCGVSSGSTSHADVQAARTGNKAAIEKIISQHQAMINKLAKQFANQGSKFDKELHKDLKQIGAQAVIADAVRKYDPEKKSAKTGQPVKFSTYAHHWINGRMRNHVASLREVAGKEKGILSKPKQAGKAVFDPAAPTERKQELQSDEIDAALGKLSHRERDVVERHMGLGGKEQQTLREIADHHGVSVPRVHQIHEAAIKKLREHLTGNDFRTLAERTLNAMVLNAAVDGVFAWLPEMLT